MRFISSNDREREAYILKKWPHILKALNPDNFLNPVLEEIKKGGEANPEKVMEVLERGLKEALMKVDKEELVDLMVQQFRTEVIKCIKEALEGVVKSGEPPSE